MADDLARRAERFTEALERLEQAPRLARPNHISRFLDAADGLLCRPGGVEVVYAHAPRFRDAGVFTGTDWDRPEILQPGYVPATLAEGGRATVVLECLSQLRLLAVAEGVFERPEMSAEHAGHYLREVLALCLDYVFERKTEASRARGAAGARRVLRFIADALGYEDLLEQLVDEILRLLRQRPIHVEDIRVMVTRLSAYCYEPGRRKITMPAGAERLISSLYGPSPASREDPGLEIYAERLAGMDAGRLQEEAAACSRSMHDTGLASPYHAVLVRHLLRTAPDLLGASLGLSTTGLDGFLTYRGLLHALIDKAIHPETCQALLGLAMLLERAVLHHPGVPGSLWRQLKLNLTAAARERVIAACGASRPAEVFLLAGVLSILGQPLGIGQGDNPTCQSARALSLWAYTDPDYLLQLLAWAARDDDILMKFHGRPLSSALLPEGGSGKVGSDLDPVSVVLVPHLDRVYAAMLEMADTAGEDPHVQVNPEFHGWRVGRGFAIAVDVPSGKLEDYESFLRLFYACYHPAYNGGHPVIHPPPVGLAVTDAVARFIGWHAITLLRITLDPAGVARAYFYNPNNDKGQDWGNGVVVSTDGHGEVPGESSLPVTQFASRLYLFHYDPLEIGDTASVPRDEVCEVHRLATESWAADRIAEEASP